MQVCGRNPSKNKNMNIFILDEDPIDAAVMLCDKHVPKMILESAQLLCSPFEPGMAPYRRTHYNHPCAIWVRSSSANYEWLLNHACALADEYWKRYDKRRHKSESVLDWCFENELKIKFPSIELTPFAQCMPEQYKVPGDAVQAYRNYYIGEKARFAKWERGTKVPEWWTK